MSACLFVFLPPAATAQRESALCGRNSDGGGRDGQRCPTCYWERVNGKANTTSHFLGQNWTNCGGKGVVWEQSKETYVLLQILQVGRMWRQQKFGSWSEFGCFPTPIAEKMSFACLPVCKFANTQIYKYNLDCSACKYKYNSLQSGHKDLYLVGWIFVLVR